MSEEKKIIIDDDWKSQVAAEKEAMKKEAAAQDAPSSEQSEPGPVEMPPASLELLFTTFATEALVALGHVPNPMTGEASVQPGHAQYAIDMLEVLQEKTKGNLTPGEEKMLDDLLHQLRMMYVGGGVGGEEVGGGQ